MNEQLVVEGSVENIIFRNKENSYTVFSIVIENDKINDDLICVGFLPDVNEGEDIKVVGNIVNHPSYGKQLNVISYNKSLPKSIKSIEKYLASGVISGISSGFAKKIVEKFKEDTLNIIETKPEKLSEIKGISLQKAKKIGEIFSEQSELRNIMIFLQEYGITPAYAIKIYKRFKENTIDIVKKNPYSLSEEIFGIGFKIADNIAQKIGIKNDSEYRVKAGIKFVLNRESNSNGNVYLPEEKLIYHSCNLLSVDREIIKNTINLLQMERQICSEIFEDERLIFLNPYFYAESYVAKKLLELSFNKTVLDYDFDAQLETFENINNISLAKNQKEAIKEALTNGVLVITGGPGTGKTTTINTVISLLKNQGYEIELTAPTGRAAKRITSTTGLDAQTVHRLLGVNYINDDRKKQSFEKNQDNPIEADIIIVDETSMVDIILMNNLLKAIPSGSRLILVGDVDQLPSVGAGNVLKDIINSNCIKVVKLDQVFRQAQESAIIMNAHRINNGEYPILNEKEKDFFFIKKFNIEELIETLIQLVTKRVPNFASCNPISDIQVLVPMRKTQLGTNNLNCVLQNVLNPSEFNKNEKQFRDVLFREGDKVIQIKNNYNLVWKLYENEEYKDEGVGVFNGDEGFISWINNDSEFIEVVFDENKYVRYDFTQLDELELAYAITIHKSQGSEYKVVIMPIHSGPEMLLTRNLLYTGVTRAKELAIIVGVPNTLYKMVDNNREVDRYTWLKQRIIELNSFMLEEKNF